VPGAIEREDPSLFGQHCHANDVYAEAIPIRERLCFPPSKVLDCSNAFPIDRRFPEQNAETAGLWQCGVDAANRGEQLRYL
jgi:hypothetical protein